MKRYLLFMGYDYYPYGGFQDFAGSFESIEEAQEFFGNKKEANDWAHIFDQHKEELVYWWVPIYTPNGSGRFGTGHRTDYVWQDSPPKHYVTQLEEYYEK